MKDENYYNEKSTNTVMIVVVTVLVMLVLGLIGFIIYDKVINKTNEPNLEENNKTNEPNLEENNNKEEYNYLNIDKELNNGLSSFINYRGITNSTDLLSTSKGRLELLNFYLMKNELCTWHDDGIIQRFPYVKYDVYKSKYIELFGNKISLDADLKNVDDTVANDCNDVNSLSGKNICWNGTYGETPNDIELKSTKVSNISGSKYSIIGNYTNKGDYETGTFEIQYVKTNDAKYLTSIKLTKK